VYFRVTPAPEPNPSSLRAHGVPQRLLTDNGSALNPSRRGYDGQLVAHVRALGVEPITGKPYRPTTQGKNERFHQTLFRFLDKQPIAGTLAELQEQVDCFDAIYNTERPHQGLPGRITPQQAWDATPKVDAPRPGPPAPRTPVPFRTDGGDERVRVVKVAGNGNRVRPRYLLPDQPRLRRSTRVRRLRDRRRHVLRRPRHPHRRVPVARTRHPLRRQRQAPWPTAEDPPTVTDVLRHQLSPMS